MSKISWKLSGLAAAVAASAILATMGAASALVLPVPGHFTDRQRSRAVEQPVAAGCSIAKEITTIEIAMATGPSIGATIVAIMGVVMAAVAMATAITTARNYWYASAGRGAGGRSDRSDPGTFYRDPVACVRWRMNRRGSFGP